MMEGISQVSDAVGKLSQAAGGLAHASANATMAVADLGGDILNTATGVGAELWHGIDLLETKVSRTSMRAGASSAGDLSRWIMNKTALPLASRSWFAEQAASADTRVSIFESTWESIHINSSYSRLWCKVRSRRDGSVVMVLITVTVDYVPIWANPAWEAMGFLVEAQTPQILKELRATVSSLPEPPEHLLAIDDATVERELGLRLAWWVKMPWTAKGLAAVTVTGTLSATVRVARWSGLIRRLGQATRGGARAVLRGVRGPESAKGDDEPPSGRLDSILNVVEQFISE